MIKINNLLEGMFGYIIYDIQKDKYYISRDHIGIIPLYIG
jgi:asparagine synthase (glutamine-hydrolysing)